MNIPPEYLIERKRTKTQLAKWKIAALVFLLFIVVVLGKNFVPKNLVSDQYSKIDTREDHIAVLTFEEIIYDNLQRVKKIERLGEDERVKAVIVHINSPGGSVVGSEMLYNAFRIVSETKPVVAVMDSVAASGGYLISLGADYIIAHNGTITGSIGVLMQTAEITELAEKIGIKFNNFKSNDLKANPSFTEKLTPEAEKAVMDNIFDVYDYFVELVAKRRSLDLGMVKQIADGRIYSAKMALNYKLIDEIGNERSAIKWLENEKQIEKNLKLIEVRLTPKDKFFDILFEDLDNSIKNIFFSTFLGIKSIM